MKYLKKYENIFDIQKVESDLATDIQSAIDDEKFIFIPFGDKDLEEYEINSHGKSNAFIEYKYDKPIITSEGWFTYWIHYTADVTRQTPFLFTTKQNYRLGAIRNSTEPLSFDLINTHQEGESKGFDLMIDDLDDFYFKNMMNKSEIQEAILKNLKA